MEPENNTPTETQFKNQEVQSVQQTQEIVSQSKSLQKYALAILLTLIILGGGWVGSLYVQDSNTQMENLASGSDVSTDVDTVTAKKDVNEQYSVDVPEKRTFFAPEFSAKYVDGAMIGYDDDSVKIDDTDNWVRVPTWVLKESFKVYLGMSLVPLKTVRPNNRTDTLISNLPDNFVFFDRDFSIEEKQISSSIYIEKEISSDTKLTLEIPYGMGTAYKFNDRESALAFAGDYVETISFSPSVLSEIAQFYAMTSEADVSKNKQALASANKSVRKFALFGAFSDISEMLKMTGVYIYNSENKTLVGFCGYLKGDLEAKGLPTDEDYKCVDSEASVALYVEVEKDQFQCFDVLKGKAHSVSREKTNSAICDAM